MKSAHWIALIAFTGLCAAQGPAVRTPSEFKTMTPEDRAGKLKPGDAAQDFSLKVRHSEKIVTLSSYGGKVPVALVFGSYTWPPFRAQVGALNALAAKYKGKVEFVLVYIREAHPTDGWQVAANERDGILVSSAKTYGEKEELASACVRNLGIDFTTVVDNLDNKVELGYAGWPDRLYLVGKNGRIAWKGDPGPKGFKPPELEAAIESELKR